jgi:DNA-binding response OmpR family regulator
LSSLGENGYFRILLEAGATMSEERQTTIVVIEDDPVIRTVLRKRLQAAGHGVVTASDGRSGLEAVRRAQPDLVLTDWMMPEMDGEAVLRAIRSDPGLRHTYVIVLTSRDSSSDRIAGLTLGADDYLGKPWSDEELLARVRAGLRVQTLQRDLATMERRAALLTVAATLSHEINNPLTVLSAAIQIARQRPPAGAALRDFLDRCQRQVERVAAVVKSFEETSEMRETSYVGTRRMLELPLGRVESGPAPADRLSVPT